MYSQAFEKSFQKVLEAEGGYVNHPNDRGGPTNYGITIGTLKSWRRANITEEDVKNLQLDEVKQIYFELYWKPLRFEEIEGLDLFKMVLFDQAVNRGVGAVVRQIQKAIGVQVDGVFGTKTFEAFKTKIKGMNEKTLCLSMVKGAQECYFDIVDKDSSQYVFLRGWIKRTNKLIEMIIS